MARVLGENDNVVRVMSVHKSKGLEFPVVIVAGLGRPFNLADSKAPMVLHKELGIGSRYVNLTTRRRSESIAAVAIKERLRLESLAEEMRILYVAMTRAQARLFMVGTVNNLDKKAAVWARPQGSYELSQAKGIMDWLGPLWIQHRWAGPAGVPGAPASLPGDEEVPLTLPCSRAVNCFERAGKLGQAGRGFGPHSREPGCRGCALRIISGNASVGDTLCRRGGTAFKLTVTQLTKRRPHAGNRSKSQPQ